MEFRHLEDEPRPMPKFYLRKGSKVTDYTMDGEVVTIEPPFVVPEDGLYEVSVWDGQVFRGPLVYDRPARRRFDKLELLQQLEMGYDPNESPMLSAFARSTALRPRRPLTRRQRLRIRRRAITERIGEAWQVLRHGLPERDDW